MSKLIDSILILGFFSIFIWAVIEYLPLIRRIIDIFIVKNNFWDFIQK